MKTLLTVSGFVALALVNNSFAIERLTPIQEPGLKAESKKKPKVAKAWLGVAGRPVGEALAAQLGIEHGVTLELVAPDGSAGKAGIKKFDVITKIGDTKIKGMKDLRKVMQGAEVADTLEVEVLSGGELATHKIVLDAHPGNFSKATKGRARIRPLHDQPSFSRGRLPQSLHGAGMSDSERERIEEMMAARLQQMEQEFAAMDLQMADLQQMSDKALNSSFSQGKSSFTSSVTMLDDQGSILISSTSDNGQYVTVKDTAGKVLYSGPYNSDEEKAAVPADLRERVDALGIGKANSGFSFSLGN